MIKLKNVAISLLYIIGGILILTFVTTLFSYFNIISNKTTSILKIIIPVISLIIGGFNIGKKSNKKGWIEGIKLGIIFIILLIIFEFLALDINFEIKNFLYYVILVLCSMLGSMIGISTKKNR